MKLKMDSDNSFRTPNKQESRSTFPFRFHNGQAFQSPISSGLQQTSNIKSTPGSINRKTGLFHLINAIGTPPSRLTKVINPFEAHLMDRLHQPIVFSPSLFQPQSTPKHSSTQFEWTIDDISSFNPANVEAHETQFMSQTDPELEAKAQAAIHSFFKEHVIVPSPIDCQLRNQKIILKSDSQLTENPIERKKRDGTCQTILTLPPILPKEIEDMLKPFFSYNQDQQQSPTKDCDTNTISCDSRETSILRRKLFHYSIGTTTDDEGEIEPNFELKSPLAKSPEKQYEQLVRNFDSSDDQQIESPNLSTITVDKSSFGSLSPISNPNGLAKLTGSKKSNRSYLSTSSIFQSTPERPQSICRTFSDTSVNNTASAKRKLIDSSNFMHCEDAGHLSLTNSIEYEYNEDFQMSQSSTHSSQTTPTRRRYRTINRKNLSRSFLSMSQEDEQIDFPDPKTDNKDHLNQTDSGFTEVEMRDIQQSEIRSAFLAMQTDLI